MSALVLMAVLATSQVEAEVQRSEWVVNGAYFGETLLHPGLLVGVERRLQFWGRTPVLREHGLFAEGDVGSWWHARNSVGLFAEMQLGYRLVFVSGFRVELLGGAGYLHTFVSGPLYAVDAQGAVSTVTDAGRPGLMLSAALGLGWEFSKWSLFLRAGAFGQYPYNDHLLPHLMGQLGVSIPLGGAS